MSSSHTPSRGTTELPAATGTVCPPVLVQMESEHPKESVQGVQNQDSEKASNTIITRDSGQEIQEAIQPPLFSNFASSEPGAAFEVLTDRWLAMEPIEVTTTQATGSIVGQYVFPEYIYTHFRDAVANLPFSSYLYSDLEFEIRFVVNANRFHSGRLIAAYRNDAYAVEKAHASPISALTRPHILLDLSTNVEGVLKVPFDFHRAFVRNVEADSTTKCVRTGYSTLVTVYVLSPLVGGADAPNNVNVRPFLKISKARFYGMSYRVEFQMDTLGVVMDVVAPPALRKLLRGIEIVHDQVKKNYDKPADYRTSTIVPQPSAGFCWGKGPTMAFPLRLTPSAVTPNIGTTACPKTTLDIARIWGCRQASYWKTSGKPGDLLIDIAIDPTVRDLSLAYVGFPTPLEAVCNMYNFWSGTIEVRLDFISNAFHTGAVMICAEFGRRPAIGTIPWKSALNTYTKTFHLGEQKSVEFTIPYIYDTVWRRSNNPPYDPDADTMPFSAIDRSNPPIHSVINPSGRLRVYIVNELRPPPTVAQDIEILTFWRAGENFRVHSLTQSSMVPHGSSPAATAYHNVAYRVADTARNVNVTAKGSQLVWADLVDFMGAGRATASQVSGTQPPTTRAPAVDTKQDPSAAKAKRHAPQEETEAPPVPTEVNKLPHKEEFVPETDLVWGEVVPENTLCVQVYGEGIYRQNYELFTGSTSLIKPIETWAGSKVAWYPVIKCGKCALEDRPYGAVRFADWQSKYTASEWEQHLQQLTPQTQAEDAHDPTISFSSGIPALQVQTTEDQTSIKDIMRRPILLVEGKDLEMTWNAGGRYGFILPVMTPDFYANASGSFRLSSGYSNGLCTTPQALLCSMFRFWRGTLRYTIMVHDTLAQPVYVTHIPHSGTHIFGNGKSAIKPDKIVAPYGCGLSSQVIIPSVNPVLTVEVPFDCENLWCLTNIAAVHTDALPRDRTDINVGHLIISATKDARTISIWWAAGDDFEFGNFYGIPECHSGSYLRSLAERDMIPTTQMEALRTFSSEVRALPLLTGQAKATLHSSERAIKDIREQVAETSGNIDQLTNEVREKVATTGTKLDNLLDRGADVLTFVQKQLEAVLTSSHFFITAGQTALTVIKDMVLDLSTAIVTKSWFAVAVGLLRSITTVLQSSTDCVLNYAGALGKWFSIHMGSVPFTQMESDNTATLVGILASIVGTAIGVKVHQSEKYDSYFEGLIGSLTTSSTMTYLNGMIRFVEKVFECTKQMVLDGLAYIDPQARALRKLCANSEEVDLFVREVNRYTLEVNVKAINDMHYRQKIWTLVLQAHMFQRALLQTPQSPATTGLAAACRQIIKFANDHHIDLTSSPVRFEPFGLGLYGAPGIGKSFLTNELCSLLLSSVGMNVGSSDMVYTRPPGVTFWDGYRNQPVILYDDFGNMTRPEHLSEQIKELYQVKTTAEFIANMASLTDKGMRGTPIIVMMNSNDDFPNCIGNVCSDKQAVYRRRNELVEVQLKEGYNTATLGKLDPELLRQYPHLRFRFHKNPADPLAGYENVWYDWDEFTRVMVKRFKDYYNIKMASLKYRIKTEIDSVLSKYATHEIVDPYVAFWDLSSRMSATGEGTLPYDTIATAVAQVQQALQSLKDDQLKIVEDKPSTQGPSLSGLLAGCTLASLTSEQITTQVACQLRKLNRWLWETSGGWHPIRECVLCHRQRECGLVCKRYTQHYVCLECGPACHGTCPTCSTELEGCITSRGNGVISFIRSLCIRLTGKVAEAFALLADIWGFPQLKVHAAMTRLTAFLALLTPEDSTAACAYAASHIVFTLLPDTPDTSFESHHTQPKARISPLPLNSQRLAHLDELERTFEIEEAPVTQTEEPIFFDALETPVTQGESPIKADLGIYHVQLRESELRAFTAKVVPTSRPCLHQYLMDNVEFARYHDGLFHVVDDAGCDLNVPISPCEANGCAFRESSKFLVFLEQYLASHKQAICVSLASYYNKSITQDMLRSYIPEFLIPAWAKKTYTSANLKTWAWWEAVKTFTQRHHEIIKMLSLAGAALGGLLAAWKFFPIREIPGAESGIYDVSTARHLRRTAREVKITRGPRPATQSEAMVDQTMNKVVRNQVMIRMRNTDNRGRSMIAQGIYGHYAILPKHYVQHIKDHYLAGYQITIEPVQYHVESQNHLRHSYTFDESDFKSHSDTDLAYFRLPNSYRLFKDIRSLFWTDEDIQKQTLYSDAEIVAGPTSSRSFIRVCPIEIKGYRSKLDVLDENGTLVVNRDVLVYDYSEKGACGSLIVANKTTRPLLAMHTAGMSSGEGYGTIITQDLLSTFLPQEPVVQVEEVDLPPISDTAFVIDDLNVALDYLGELPKDVRPHVPSKTKIRPSAVHKVAPLTAYTEPCILHKEDPRYNFSRTPLYHGVSKHGIRTRDYPRSLVKRALDALYDGWFAGMAPVIVQPKRLSYEEAICGFEAIPFYDPMKLSTSAGYPWTSRGRGTTKDAWLTVHRDSGGRLKSVDIDPELLEELARKERLRQEGVVPVTMFVDTLKDERRLPEKLSQAGGTRVFCSSPIDFTIAMRQNLLHFCAAMMKARLSVFTAIGINPKGVEWTTLFDRLNEMGGGKVFQLDYSNFGPSFNAVVAEAAGQIIKRWTLQHVEGVNEAELDALIMECLQSIHIAGGTVYRQFCGSPSGAAITTVINSLVNLLYVFITWVILLDEARTGALDLWQEFRNNVFVAVYGDDLIGAVRPKYQDLFNGVTIASKLAEYGIVATDAVDKAGGAQPFVSIYKAEFLKRGFLRHPTREGYVLAPLRWVSINDATQWVWSGPNLKAATQVNCEAALLEAHGHGPRVFNDFKRDVNVALRKRKISPLTTEWDHLDKMWFEEGLPEEFWKFE